MSDIIRQWLTLLRRVEIWIPLALIWGAVSSIGWPIAEHFKTTSTVPQEQLLAAELSALAWGMLVDPFLATLALFLALRLALRQTGDPERQAALDRPILLGAKLLVAVAVLNTISTLGLVIIVPGLIALVGGALLFDPVAFVTRGALMAPGPTGRRALVLLPAILLVSTVYVPTFLFLVYEIETSWLGALAFRSGWQALEIALLCLWVAASHELVPSR